jgi:hypothetical protein
MTEQLYGNTNLKSTQSDSLSNIDTSSDTDSVSVHTIDLHFNTIRWDYIEDTMRSCLKIFEASFQYNYFHNISNNESNYTQQVSSSLFKQMPQNTYPELISRSILQQPKFGSKINYFHTKTVKNNNNDNNSNKKASSQAQYKNKDSGLSRLYPTFLPDQPSRPLLGQYNNNNNKVPLQQQQQYNENFASQNLFSSFMNHQVC